MNQVAYKARAYRSILSMKQLQIFLLSIRWDATPLQGYSINFSSTDLYTWEKRGTVKVKCLAQELNANGGIVGLPTRS